jgi:hypothetical protein
VALKHGTKEKPEAKEPKFWVTGVAFNRKIADRGNPPIIMPPGILHCGCLEDDALLDFWWFKIGKITSPFNGMTEGWLTDALEPRPCAFMAKLFHEMSGLNIDDLYSVDTDINGTERGQERRLKLQISKLQLRVDTLQKIQELEELLETEEDGPLLY